ncbi:MAG: hypothetical protein ACK5Q5_15770 [Planctomycetaceae bacterium]
MSLDKREIAIPRPQWGFRLTTQNPFYLISAFCFIHSLNYAVGGGPGQLQIVPRCVLILLYLTVVVSTVLLLVRRWNQWADARSLLLVVLLLFIELDLGVDVLLVQSPVLGIATAIGILGLIAAVSELLLRRLPLHLPASYRIPYYLLWGQIVLYPGVCATVSLMATEHVTRWVIAAFLPLGSLLLLTLLPAVHRGPQALFPARHPYPWPLYPWSIFSFLGLILIFRQHALGVSFDPVANVRIADDAAGANLFGWWMLSPLCLAVGILLHAGSWRTRWQPGLTAAALIPFAGIGLALVGTGRDELARRFLEEVTDQLGSPVWWSVVICIGFQLVSRLRGYVEAEGWLLAALSLGLLIGPHTISPQTLSAPSAEWLAICGLVAAVFGWRHNSAGWQILAGLSGAAAAAKLGWWHWWDVASIHWMSSLYASWLLVASWLVTGDSRLLLRGIGWTLLLTGSISNCLGGMPDSQVFQYAVWLASLAGAFGFFFPSAGGLKIAAINMSYLLLRAAWTSYQMLAAELQWRGLHWLAAALCLFFVGALVSSVRRHTPANASEQLDSATD